METWGEKVTEVKHKSFNDPTFFGDKYIIGTARSVFTVNCFTVTWIDKLVIKPKICI